jgi:lipopolysaccharide export system protein LptA
MVLPVRRLRRWFAVLAVLMIVTVAGMYFYAQFRVRKLVHDIPAKVGLDIQQTAEGFSVSKSVEGRTLFTLKASKAVQFKAGSRAELHNVKIIIYGRDASRFDQIAGDDFEYDPASGQVTAHGRVFIDLQANPEGAQHSDQTAPAQLKDPIHLESEGLVFNKNTGDATATGKVVFETPQASGSAVGIDYVANTGTMNLLSSVAMTVRRPEPLDLHASHGVITKAPRLIVLNAVHLVRERQRMQSDQATFFLREDNTVERILAEGNVESEFAGKPQSRNSKQAEVSDTSSAERSAHARSDRAEIFLTGNRNLLTTAILSGNVQLRTEGSQPSDAAAGRVTLHFVGQQILQTVHAEDGVRLTQKNGAGGTGSIAASTGKSASPSKAGQDLEMTAPVMDFLVKDGRLIERAETSGPPQIVITQPATNQKTVVTASKFTAKFTDKNRLATLHGEPDAKIVSSKMGAPNQTDRISTSQMLDVAFLPEGGISSITQTGAFTYVDGPQKAWAQRGEYTAADQMLVLTGSPRVVDTGMATTAQTIRVNRATGDAVAEGNVKSSYSELKAQPDGGMLASSDPIHVTSRNMTAHHSPSIAVYSGDARLWQNANLIEGPTLQFDRDKRSLVAQASATQAVSTVLAQVDKSGKVSPVRIMSAHLDYADADRKMFLNGGVTVKGSDATMTADRMTVFLRPRSESPVAGSPGTPGQVDRIVAEEKVIVTEPTRHATGERLVYTAAEDKFVLTGGPLSGPPSIFDAERGKTTGDSLTFYKRDDRVLVEGNKTSPTVTRTQVAR